MNRAEALEAADQALQRIGHARFMPNVVAKRNGVRSKCFGQYSIVL
jgi:hypothetical protein